MMSQLTNNWTNKAQETGVPLHMVGVGDGH